MPILTVEQFEELQLRLRLYHEAASYYVPEYADEVHTAWADVIDLTGALAESVSADQLSLFAEEGADTARGSWWL